MNKALESFLEFAPLLVFFIAYKFEDLIFATAALIMATAVSIGVTYFYKRKIPVMPLVSAVILGIFGGLTVFSGDKTFIKIKPTLVNILFAVILFGGFMLKKPLLKYLMGSALKMKEEAWLVFSLRWAVFFIFLAILNEIIWRNFSEEFWVKFKVFGMLPISIIFTISQIPFLKKNMIDENGK